MNCSLKRLLVALVAGVATLSAHAFDNTIGLSFPAATHGWMGAITKNAEDEAKLRKVKYVLTTATNPAQQNKDIDEMIAKKVSAVVMLPVDTEGMTSAAQKLKLAKIPLIIVDREVNTSDYTALIKGDNVGIGTNAARYIGGALKGVGSVVEIIGVPASVTTQRAQGFRDELARLYPGMKIIASQAGDFQQEKSYAAMNEILKAHPKIDAVYTHDDEMALGVLRAIKEAKRSDIKIVTGAGGNKTVYQMIAQGDNLMRATFVYSPLMAKDAVKLAVDLLDGKPIKSKDTTIPATAVHMGNVARFVDPTANY